MCAAQREDASDDPQEERAPSARLPGWRARYDDLGELARGGLSSVRVVFDRVMRRRVAMKVHDRARDPGGAEHFLEEARITGQLDHPNIIPIHDVQEDELAQPSRFTMKLVEGETLADLIERRGGKPRSSDELQSLVGIFLKVCDAVSFAHSRGVVHCDLKPSNVLIGSHGQVYVTDWGAALRLRPTGSTAPARAGVSPTVVVGTPAFMAPEQAAGAVDRIDARTDVYGLGGILSVMLTSAPPRDGGSPAADLELARRGFVRSPQDVPGVGPVPPGLCQITVRALQPEAEARYPSVDVLKAEVERFMRGGGWFESVHRPEGTCLVGEGDAPDAAYILVEGSVEMFHEVGGETRSIGLLAPGDVFGEIAIFGASRRTASVIARSDVTLVRVTRDALQRELEHSGWLKIFVEALAARFLDVDRELREYERRDACAPESESST